MNQHSKKRSFAARPNKMSISSRMKETHLAYENDFYKWTQNQIAFLQKKEFTKLDIDHLIEEIESLGNSEKNAIESHMIVLFVHLLKIKYQPAMRCKSWDNSVENAK